MDVALGEEEVVGGGGVDVGYTQRVAVDVDRRQVDQVVRGEADNAVGRRPGAAVAIVKDEAVDARITAVRAGIEVDADQIASHYQAGGNVVPTVQALIAAQKAGIRLGDIIVAAVKETGLKLPLVVRLEGNNVVAGKKTLAASGLTLITADSMSDAALKVVKAVL